MLLCLQLDDDLTELSIAFHSSVGIGGRGETVEYCIDDWLKDIVLETMVDILMCLLESFRTSCHVIQAVEFHVYTFGKSFTCRKISMGGAEVAVTDIFCFW